VDPFLKTVRSFAGRYRHGVAVVLVVLATLLFLPLRSYLSGEQWGWPYMLIVGLTAGLAGVGPAIVAAVLSFLVWNFLFIHPNYTLQVADSGDVVHLLGFLVVAVSVGLLTGRLRESEEAALRQEASSAALYRLSSGMVMDAHMEQMIRLVGIETGRVLGCSGVCLWPVNDEDRTNLAKTPCPEECAANDSDRMVARRLVREAQSPAAPVFAGEDLFVLVRASRGVEGVLQLRGAKSTLDSPDQLFCDAVAHLVAAFLENRRMADEAMRASAEREAERLRTSLLSSVSHELKTPVASLTASVTDLLGREVVPSPQQTHDALSAMAEDLGRLDRSIGNLLDISRLEAQAWLPKPLSFEPGELIGAVVSDLPRTQRNRIEYTVPEDVPHVRADFVQLSLALRHVVDNALRYSDGTVTIGAKGTESSTVELWVEDDGPGIPVSERERVFEKFFRGSAGRRIPSSTGLGLSLAREIVLANGGDLRLADAAPHGTRVVMGLRTDLDKEQS